MKYRSLLWCTLMVVGWWVGWGTGWGNAQELSQGLGPLPVRNFQPVQLLFLNLPFERAEVTPQGKWALSFGFTESNTMNEVNQKGEKTELLFDLETTRFVLGAKYGLWNRVEVGLEMPFILRWGGFLDLFIEGVERMVGRLNQNREERPDNSILFRFQREGIEVFSQNDTAFGPGDLVLGAKGLVWKEERFLPAIAARFMLKLPTGSEDQLFGSGKPDIGLGLSMQKTLWRFVLYGNLNYIIPGEVFAEAGLETRNFWTAGFGGEFRWTPRFSLLLQTEFYQSAFEKVGVEELDLDLWELAFGFNFALSPNLLWQFGGIQNMVVESGADFSLHSNFVYRF